MKFPIHFVTSCTTYGAAHVEFKRRDNKTVTLAHDKLKKYKQVATRACVFCLGDRFEVWEETLEKGGWFVADPLMCQFLKYKRIENI